MTPSLTSDIVFSICNNSFIGIFLFQKKSNDFPSQQKVVCVSRSVAICFRDNRWSLRLIDGRGDASLLRGMEQLPNGRWVKLFPSKASGRRSCASSIMHGQDKERTGGFQRHGAVTQSRPIQLGPAERMMPPPFPPAICLIIPGSRSTGRWRTVGSEYKTRRPSHCALEKLLVPWMDAAGATPGCCCRCGDQCALEWAAEVSFDFYRVRLYKMCRFL